jgi:hypothetical protein
MLKTRTIQLLNPNTEQLDEVTQNYLWCDTCNAEEIINIDKESNEPKSKHYSGTEISKLLIKQVDKRDTNKSIWESEASNLTKEDLADFKSSGLSILEIKEYLEDLSHIKSQTIRQRFPNGRGSFYGSYTDYNGSQI